MAAQEGDLHVVREDHHTIENAFLSYENEEPPTEQTRRDLVAYVMTQVVRHHVGEEQYMYPAVREMLSEGDVIADRELRQRST